MEVRQAYGAGWRSNFTSAKCLDFVGCLVDDAYVSPPRRSHETSAELLPMKKWTIAARLTRIVLAVALSAAPLAAQQKRGTAPRKPAPAPTVAQPVEAIPTFDTLLADDSYKVYFEVRGVGQLIRSPAVNDLLDPVMKIGGPKEFRTALKWLDAHAETLAGS